jgi:hypothetical protein
MLKTIGIASIVCGLVGVAGAQDADLRSGDLRPRTGLVSEEVARQKLLTLGFANVRGLRMEGSRWFASAILEGRQIDLELDALSGVLYERTRREPLRPDQSGVPLMRDHSITIDRSKLINLPIVVEPFVPERSTAIRPLGDRPVAE